MENLTTHYHSFCVLVHSSDTIFPAIGCRFIALNDGVDTLSKNNDMLMIFKNVMNDFYARDTSNKIKAVRQSAYKSGKFIGCYAPYGYQKHPENKHQLIIDEKVAPIVRQIFAMRCQGYGFRKIASKLNEAGIPAPRDYYYDTIGKPNPQYQNHLWNEVTIRVILRNEAYIGNMVQNKTGKLSYKSKKTVQKPKEDWVRIENTHEPIIRKEVWERTVELDNRPSRPHSTSSGEVSLFGGLVYCLDCGFAMRYNKETHKRKNGNVAEYISYRCGNYSRSGRSACSTHTIYLKPLSEIVLADIRLKAKLIQLDENAVLEQISSLQSTEWQQEMTLLKSSLKAMENRIAELGRLIPSLYEAWVNGTVSESLCRELMGKYEAERRELNEKAGDLRQSLGTVQSERDNIHLWMDAIRGYRHIEALDRDILHSLIDRIEIGERKVTGKRKHRDIHIHYKFVGCIG